MRILRQLLYSYLLRVVSAIFVLGIMILFLSNPDLAIRVVQGPFGGERHAVDACLADPDVFEWDDPESCVEDVGRVSMWWNHRREKRRYEKDRTSRLPFGYRTKRDIEANRLMLAARYELDEDARRKAAGKLVDFADEIYEEGFVSSQIPRVLIREGMHEYVLDVLEHVDDNQVGMAVRSAVLYGDSSRWAKLADMPEHPVREQLGVVAGLCLAGEEEAARERLEMMEASRITIESDRGDVPLETAALACGIHFEEVGLSPDNVPQRAMERTYFIAIAALQDASEARRLIEAFDGRSLQGWLPVMAKALTAEEATLGDMQEWVGETRHFSPELEAHFGSVCGRPFDDSRLVLALPRVLEEGARQLDAMAEDADDDNEAMHMSVLDGEGSSERVALSERQALERLAEALRLEAARHYAWLGDKEAAARLASTLELQSVEASMCAASVLVESGEYEAALDILDAIAVSSPNPFGTGSRDFEMGIAKAHARWMSGDGEGAWEIAWELWRNAIIEGNAGQPTQREVARLTMALALEDGELGNRWSLLRDEGLEGEWARERFGETVEDAVELFETTGEERKRKRWEPGLVRGLIDHTPESIFVAAQLVDDEDVELWLDGFHFDYDDVHWRHGLQRQRMAELRGDEEAAGRWRKHHEELRELATSVEKLWLLAQM